LGAIRIVPDVALGQLEFYFLEAVLALVEVKDTP